jgi:hypothetical protein
MGGAPKFNKFLKNILKFSAATKGFSAPMLDRRGYPETPPAHPEAITTAGQRSESW